MTAGHAHRPRAAQHTYLFDVSPIDALEACLEDVRVTQARNPSFPPFRRQDLPRRSAVESELAWSMRCLDEIAAWRDRCVRAVRVATLCRLAAIVTVHAVNGEQHGAS